MNAGVPALSRKRLERGNTPHVQSSWFGTNRCYGERIISPGHTQTGFCQNIYLLVSVFLSFPLGGGVFAAGGFMKGSSLRIWNIWEPLLCGDFWDFYSIGFQKDSPNPNALEVLQNSSLRSQYIKELVNKPKGLSSVTHGAYLIGEEN